jgi:hypothetical protein
MPRPIDNRDVTLSNPRSEAPRNPDPPDRDGDDLLIIRRVDIDVHAQFDCPNQQTNCLNLTKVVDRTTLRDETLHEVRITAGTNAAASIWWRRIANSTTSDSYFTEMNPDLLDPQDTGTPSTPTGNPARRWQSQMASWVFWSFGVDVWVKGTNGHRVDIRDSAIQNGMRYTFDVVNVATGARLFRGDLHVWEVDRVH